MGSHWTGVGKCGFWIKLLFGFERRVEREGGRRRWRFVVDTVAVTRLCRRGIPLSPLPSTHHRARPLFLWNEGILGNRLASVPRSSLLMNLTFCFVLSLWLGEGLHWGMGFIAGWHAKFGCAAFISPIIPFLGGGGGGEDVFQYPLADW
jgi:hypothetical protein